MYSIPTATCNVNYWLMPLTTKNSSKKFAPVDIINAACTAFDVRKYDLLSSDRHAPLPRIRFICFNIMRVELKMTLKAIGEEFNLDHTSVMNGLKHIKDELSMEVYRDKLLSDIFKVKNLL